MATLSLAVLIYLGFDIWGLMNKRQTGAVVVFYEFPIIVRAIKY